MLHITCLGALRLAFDRETPPLALTPRALALFAYLAVTAAKGVPPHSRDLLADLLWSETNNQQARTNLRYQLPVLRRQLNEYLVITTQTITFQRDAPYWLDLEQLCAALTARPETIATPALQATLDLYQGEFLAAPTHPQGNALLVRLLCHTAHFYRRTGKVEYGERAATEALALAQQLGDPAL